MTKYYSELEKRSAWVFIFVASISFGIWQESFFAGVWMFSLPIVAEYTIHG